MKKYNDLLTEIVGLKSIEDIIFIKKKSNFPNLWEIYTLTIMAIFTYAVSMVYITTVEKLRKLLK